MGRSKRRSTFKKKEKEDKDVECHNEPEKQVSEDFYDDDVDKYFKEREKILLNTEGEDDDTGNEDDDDVEEIVGLSDEDDDDDDDSNDDDDDDDDLVDEDESEDDFRKALPSEDAWGKRMSTFYHVDKIGDNIESDEEAEQLAEEEEEEAMLIQKRLAATLDEQDFDTENFQLKTEIHADGNDIEGDDEFLKEKALVQKDLSKLSKNEKLEILVKDSPELLELLEEFRAKMQIILTTLQPLVNMARTGKVSEQGRQYLEVRHQLYLNYCINIGFYLLLKARQVPVRDHPVISKLVQYRMLIKDLEPLDERFEPEIQMLLQKQGSNDEIENSHMEKENSHSSASNDKLKLSALLDPEDEQESLELKNARPQSHKKKVKRKTEPMETTVDVIDPLAYYEQVKLAKKRKKEEKEKKFRLAHQEPEFVVETEALVVDGKRGITYQMSKNKGLTPKRKKELRNPRVKHRKKFQKAVIKRKSQVRPVVTELQRYGGETTGVRSNLVRSVKIK